MLGGPAAAAARLGLKRTTLQSRMRSSAFGAASSSRRFRGGGGSFRPGSVVPSAYSPSRRIRAAVGRVYAPSDDPPPAERPTDSIASAPSLDATSRRCRHAAPASSAARRAHAVRMVPRGFAAVASAARWLRRMVTHERHQRIHDRLSRCRRNGCSGAPRSRPTSAEHGPRRECHDGNGR